MVQTVCVDFRERKRLRAPLPASDFRKTGTSTAFSAELRGHQAEFREPYLPAWLE